MQWASTVTFGAEQVRAGRCALAASAPRPETVAEVRRWLADQHDFELGLARPGALPPARPDAQALLDRLLLATPDIHIVTDACGVVMYGNAAAAVLVSPAPLAGSDLRDYVLKPAARAFADLLASLQASDSDVLEDIELMLAGEQELHLIVRALVVPVRDEGGLAQIHWLLRDVTQIRESEFEARVASLVYDSLAEGVMVCDVHGDVLMVNRAFSRITGYQPEEVLGRNPRFLNSGLQGRDFYDNFWARLQACGNWEGRVFNRRRNGQVFCQAMTVNAVNDAAGKVVSYVAVFSDLSPLHDAERQIAHLSCHDPLTGLPNRTLFYDRLQQAINGVARDGSEFTLAIIDLDRFRPINDALGHEAGDAVLQDVAQRLQAAVRDVDTVARLAGDEFAVIAPGLAGADDVARFAEKLLATLATPVAVRDEEVHVSASLGFAQYPADAIDPDALLRLAEAAASRSKDGGGNLATGARDLAADALGDPRLSLEAELRRALERGQMSIVYQPQVTLDGRVAGVEALLRWQHPVFGPVGPDVFIPIAERSSTIVILGEWVIRQACAQLAQWRANGLADLRMAINVSPRQLRRPDFYDTVRAAIAASGVPPASIELEITETQLLGAVAGEGSRALAALRLLGVGVAADDFGTGYSSLSRLRDLPVDRLKIDRAFVSGLADDAGARAIATCILDMGRAMGLQVVAEGVESPEQLSILAAGGCPQIQGFLFARPMAAADVPGWIADFARNPGVSAGQALAA